jgi:hypothetical protein
MDYGPWSMDFSDFPDFGLNFLPHLQCVKHTLSAFPGEPLCNREIWLPLQPAKEEAALFKGSPKNKENKICGNRKGSYLCNPKTKGAEKRRC